MVGQGRASEKNFPLAFDKVAIITKVTGTTKKEAEPAEGSAEIAVKDWQDKIYGLAVCVAVEAGAKA